jgi:hypothetical protein
LVSDSLEKGKGVAFIAAWLVEHGIATITQAVLGHLGFFIILLQQSAGPATDCAGSGSYANVTTDCAERGANACSERSG